MSSRLFQEIRERLGYTYDIGSYFRKYSDIGSFAISAGIENKKLEPAVRAIVKELKKIKRQPPKADELKRAKEFYIGQLHLALENTLDHMMWLGENISLGAKFYIAGEIIKLINKVKPIDISNLANEIFRDRSMKIALIGPHRRKDLEYLDDLLTLKV